MVISNFDVKNVAIFPRKTNPELIINSDAQLPLSFCLQSLQTVAGWNPKVIQTPRCI